MRSAVIAQARNSSTRYPKKMLHNFLGKPAIEWVIDRCQDIDTDYKILATSEDKNDDILATIAMKKGWYVIRGSIDDVLSRYAKAIKEFNLDIVVRITCDCILIDYRLANFALTKFYEAGADYLVLTNIIDGFDVEVIKATAIIEADTRAKLPSEREHVTPYIRKTEKFKKIYLKYTNENLSHIHLSLDYKEDAEVIGYILEYFNNKNFTYDDVVKLIKEKPQIIEKTKHIKPNEGYRKSLEKDYLERYKLSIQMHQKAIKVIPLGSQTFSKSKTQYPYGVSPYFIKRGQASHVWDIDGNEYIDFVNALGAIILGYNDPDITNAVKTQLEEGTIFSLPHEIEIKVAEKIIEIIPCAEMVRFGKNGSDATAGAIRLARAYTKRDHVAVCGYHGWQDWYIGSTTRNLGVPKSTIQLTHSFQYNNIDSLYKIFKEYPDQIAAVIMEPMNSEEPKNNFLEEVKELTHKNKAVFIFDETVTGFRFSKGGAQEYFGVIPDLATFGKGLANGYPLSVITGKEEIMQLMEEVFFSFTFGGETLSLAAALATMAKLQKEPVIETLWKQGRKIVDGTNALIEKYELRDIMSVSGKDCWSFLIFKDGKEYSQWQIKTLFLQEVFARGILTIGTHNISYAHSDSDILNLLDVYDQVLSIISNALKERNLEKLLRVEPIVPLFKIR